jgi:hypothetical protein
MLHPRTHRLAPLALAFACSDPASPEDAADTIGADESTGVIETGTSSGEDTGIAAAVAYYEDIKPILDARCTSCHLEGGIAPFSLTSYADAATWARSGQSAIHAGTMPPWPPADDCNEYLGLRSLTEEQIAAIDAWVGDEMPMGDPAAEGVPLTDVEPGLSRVDLSIAMPEEYTPGNSPDDYRCFLIDWPAEHTTTKYVTGFRAVPGNDAIVHHVIAFLATPEQKEAYAELDAAEDGPGYTCFGGTGGPARTWLGGWAPGSAGSDMPDGLGLAVEPGSQVILQVHYNTLSSDPAPDATSVEVKLDDAVERVAKVQPFANPMWLGGGGMLIPAGEPDVMHEFQYDLGAFIGGPTTVYSAALHMHLLGQRAKLSVERADGTSECLLAIDAWDFHWQGSYALREPVQLGEGDELRLECHYDNSAANQPYVDGVQITPKDVTWGESTTDEMCLGIILGAPT